MKKFIDLITEKIEAVLMEKTSWGRNELRPKLQQALLEALAEWYDQKGED